MKTVSLGEVDELNDAELSRHELSEPLGTTDVAFNYYRLAPGEGLPGGLHTHMDQEEVFVVVEGEATFETLAPVEDGSRDGDEVTVGAGEAIRFAPGEFQSGKNESDDELALLALGAPRDSDDLRVPLNCPDCGHGQRRFEITNDEPLFVCPECDSARIPDPCPDCGGDDLRVALDDEIRTKVACTDCEAEFDTPPTTRLSDPTE